MSILDVQENSRFTLEDVNVWLKTNISRITYEKINSGTISGVLDVDLNAPDSLFEKYVKIYQHHDMFIINIKGSVTFEDNCFIIPKCIRFHLVDGWCTIPQVNDYTGFPSIIKECLQIGKYNVDKDILSNDVCFGPKYTKTLYIMRGIDRYLNKLNDSILHRTNNTPEFINNICVGEEANINNDLIASIRNNDIVQKVTIVP